MPKRIITYGTFDLFHYGHINVLKRARALGDFLAVGVSTDEFNTLKGKKSVHSYEERVSFLKELQCVDLIFPEENWIQKRADIIHHSIDLFVMGNDWAGVFDEMLGDLCEIHILERTPDISSTLIKQKLNQPL